MPYLDPFPFWVKSTFHAMLLNNFLFLFGYSVVLVHLAKHLAAEGVLADRGGGRAISVMGVANLAGRVALGVVCQVSRFTSEAVYVVCMVACGLATLAMPAAGHLFRNDCEPL